MVIKYVETQGTVGVVIKDKVPTAHLTSCQPIRPITRSWCRSSRYRCCHWSCRGKEACRKAPSCRTRNARRPRNQNHQPEGTTSPCTSCTKKLVSSRKSQKVKHSWCHGGKLCLLLLLFLLFKSKAVWGGRLLNDADRSSTLRACQGGGTIRHFISASVLRPWAMPPISRALISNEKTCDSKNAHIDERYIIWKSSLFKKTHPSESNLAVTIFVSDAFVGTLFLQIITWLVFELKIWTTVGSVKVLSKR